MDGIRSCGVELAGRRGRARHYRERHVSGDEIIAVPDLFFMRSPMSCPIDHLERGGNVRSLFFVVEL